jgi:NlpC/P60 family putative phage cell wall peptidase
MSMAIPITDHRARIVATARRWIGTPYHHQASLEGVGCDCLGLVRGVWREIFGAEPETPPPYSRDWAEASGIETLLTAARSYFLETPPTAAQPGDVLVFRLNAGTVAKHAGILASPTTFIHAAEGASVAEVSLVPWWRRRLAAAFAFPDPPAATRAGHICLSHNPS